MKHGLLVGFLITIAPSHLVLAVSIAIPELNRPEYFWLYFALWVIVTVCFAWQVFSQRVLMGWQGTRHLHLYYTLPLGAVLIIHLAHHAFRLPEAWEVADVVSERRSRETGEEVVIENAPPRSPWRFLRALGRLSWILLRRGYFFFRAIVLATPFWLWGVMAILSTFFRR